MAQPTRSIGVMGWKTKVTLVATALVALVLGSVFVYETYWNDFSTMDHYEALGVNAQATSSEIKRAFRVLSLQYHPDKREGGGASDLHLRRFHRISGALAIATYSSLYSWLRS